VPTRQVVNSLRVFERKLTFVCPTLGEFTDLCREIMLEAKKLTLAERCSIFLLDPETQELVAKVFDGAPASEVGYVAKLAFSARKIKLNFVWERLYCDFCNGRRS